MTTKTQGTMILLGLSAVAVALVSARNTKMEAPRGDFSVRYEWRNGTVAPPYHYEVTILLGPGASGQMLLHPGYRNPGAKTAEWKESFAFTPQSREKLRVLMHQRGVFSRSWRQTSSGERPVGGGSENLEVTSGRRTFTIPNFLSSERDEADAQAVYKAINALVPPPARARLEAKRQQYEEREKAKYASTVG